MSNRPDVVLAWREQTASVNPFGGVLASAGRAIRAAARFTYMLLTGPF